MEKKTLIILICVILVCVIFFVFIKNKKVQRQELSNQTSSVAEHEILTEDLKTQYNEERNSYDIIDSAKGEVITTVENEEDLKYEMDFYKKHPNYRANPPFEN